MTVGERLRAARAARGLSLEDLARRTRIPVARLRALEQGDDEHLPPGIFSRGYVRACAIEVGLDPRELLTEFDRERPDPEPLPEPAHAPEPSPSAPRFERSGGLAFIAVAVLLTVVVLWATREQTAVPDVPMAVGLAAGVSEGQPVATTGDRLEAARADRAALVEAGPLVSAVLAVERECWVAAVADGERRIYRLMQPGEREVVGASERIWLRIGDAGAMQLSVNDGKARRLGVDGEVQTLLVTRAGATRVRAAPTGARASVEPEG